jgi:hypothetical protein
MAGNKQSDPDSESDSERSFPSVTARTWLSIWVCLHLFALAISYTNVVEPSGLHAQLTQLLRPYLRATHFGADDRPVYLTHGDPLEQPHRLQITTATGNPATLRENQWVTMEGLVGRAKPGLAASDRMMRYLSTVAMLAGNEQPSLAAELLLPIAVQNPEVTAIRIVRLPTDLNEINTGISTVYVAGVIRRDDSPALVQIRDARLNAEARPITPEVSDE